MRNYDFVERNNMSEELRQLNIIKIQLNRQIKQKYKNIIKNALKTKDITLYDLLEFFPQIRSHKTKEDIMSKVIYRGARYFVVEHNYEHSDQAQLYSHGEFLVKDVYKMQPSVAVQQRKTAYRVWKALELLNKNPRERV